MVMQFKRKKRESLEMQRIRNPEKEKLLSKIIYYGMFSAGVVLIAYAGDAQSPLHQGLAVTLITTALYRLNSIREEEKIQKELFQALYQ
jgi:hypothetical protein